MGRNRQRSGRPRRPRRRRLTPELATVTTGVLSLVAAIAVPLVTAVVDDDPPPMQGNCITIQSQYADAIRRSPEDRERILPGVDGHSTLLVDPQAEYCRLTPEIFDAPTSQRP